MDLSFSLVDGVGAFMLDHIVKIMLTGNCYKFFLIDRSFSLVLIASFPMI